MDGLVGRVGRFLEQNVKPKAQAIIDAWLEGSEDNVAIDAAGTVLRLSTMQPAERAEAMESLAQLEPMELLSIAVYDSVISQFVSDDHGDVRAAALWLLGKMLYLQKKANVSRRNLTDNGPLFRKAILDDNARVRRVALLSIACGHLGSDCMQLSGDLAGQRLLDADAGVRTAAVQLIARLEADDFIKYVDRLSMLLDDIDSNVVLEVLDSLLRLEPHDLNRYSEKLCKLLMDEDLRVRERALKTVVLLESEALIESAGLLVDFLGDANPTVRSLVAHALHHIEPAVLPRHAARLVKWIGSKDEVVRLAVIEAIGRHPAQLLHVRGDNGDTALHIAAREGDLDACKWLVSLGALIKTKNRLGQTPEALAQKAHHMQLFRFFCRLENLTTTRGGLGDALGAALSDKRPITRVEWHMIPLPGVAGYLGGIHSLLAVTVGKHNAEGMHTYVIEKAALIRGSIQDDPEQFKNGVHVSHWVDVLPNVESDALFTLGSKDIVNNTGRNEFTMRTLRDLAVDLGPYDVGACNCHHAALLIYNSCAKSSAQVPRIPNAFLTSMAWGLSGIGIDVTNSGSGSIQSQSVSGQSASIRSVSQSTSQALPLTCVQEGEFENPCAESMELPGLSLTQMQFPRETLTFPSGRRRSSKSSGTGSTTVAESKLSGRSFPARLILSVPCCGEGILQLVATKVARQCP
mmetsp:Transcript_64053/g.152766  ORF Transcript_64053/g.152766 Transcript_64053/m.152766 type:complete len:690 (+) Transcript_64053:76-2145(+)